MTGPSNPLSIRAEFVRDLDTGDYVLAIVDAGTERQVATMYLPAGVVENAVVRHLPMALELRPHGTVVAFVDRGDIPDIAAKTLMDLIEEALSVVSPEDDQQDLATLEQMLEASLAAVRQERQRLAARSGR